MKIPFTLYFKSWNVAASCCGDVVVVFSGEAEKLVKVHGKIKGNKYMTIPGERKKLLEAAKDLKLSEFLLSSQTTTPNI